MEVSKFVDGTPMRHVMRDKNGAIIDILEGVKKGDKIITKLGRFKNPNFMVDIHRQNKKKPNMSSRPSISAWKIMEYQKADGTWDFIGNFFEPGTIKSHYQAVPKLDTTEFLKLSTTVPKEKTSELSSSIEDMTVSNEETSELPSSMEELSELQVKRGVLDVDNTQYNCDVTSSSTFIQPDNPIITTWLKYEVWIPQYHYLGLPKLGTTELSSNIDDTSVSNEDTTELPYSMGELAAFQMEQRVFEFDTSQFEELNEDCKNQEEIEQYLEKLEEETIDNILTEELLQSIEIINSPDNTFYEYDDQMDDNEFFEYIETYYHVPQTDAPPCSDSITTP